jgi:hypothetical protein
MTREDEVSASVDIAIICDIGADAQVFVLRLYSLPPPSLPPTLSQPFAFAAREFLRPMMVGKIVQFTISHSVEGSKTASNGTAVILLSLVHLHNSDRD